MNAALPAIFQLTGFLAVTGFVGAFAAHIQLQFCIDRERVRKETGHDGLKVLGSVMAPVEFYKEQARIIWKIRDIGFKTFVICVGAMALLAVWAAIADVQLG